MQILLPTGSGLGYYRVFMLNLKTRQVYILDPVPPTQDKEAQMKRYTTTLLHIDTNMSLAMRKNKYPSFNQNIYYDWKHFIPDNVPACN